MHGTFEDFLSGLLAAGSGWDRASYDAGLVQDWQLDEWADGPVGRHFPHYAAWSQLSDTEWQAMACRSCDALGFVGYHFGEALLIDLGYYESDVFRGSGGAPNSWDGRWTGKNGVTSLEAFKTKAAQDVAIREAFGRDLSVIEEQLAAAGRSPGEFIGQTATYIEDGQAISVTLTLSGILAAAHLRGAGEIASLLLNGSVSSDEYGMSILKLVAQFGGYEAPGAAALIAFYETGLAGDDDLDLPEGRSDEPGILPVITLGEVSSVEPRPAVDTPGAGNGTAAVTIDNADVVISWNWGANTVVEDFDPATATIFVDWFGPDFISMAEIDGSVAFSVPSNHQTVTLAHVGLADLSPANFTILDDTTAGIFLAAVGSNPAAPLADTDEAGEADVAMPPPVVAAEAVAMAIEADDDYALAWDWAAAHTIADFDVGRDSLDFSSLPANDVDLSQIDGDLWITVSNDGGHAYLLEEVQAEDLSAANLSAASWNSVLTDAGGFGGRLEALGAKDLVA